MFEYMGDRISNAIKNIIETSSLPITIMITGMDNSLFVPYKQYIFSFFVI